MSHTPAARRGPRSVWTRYVVDGLFALREWLAESPDRAKRRNRPVLDILRLERREMPAVVLTMQPVMGSYLIAFDDQLCEIGPAVVTWGPGDDEPEFMIAWGDTTSSEAELGTITVDSEGNSSAPVLGWHDYNRTTSEDPGTAYTMYPITLTGSATGSTSVGVHQGQTIEITNSPPEIVPEAVGLITVTLTFHQEDPFETMPSTRAVSVEYRTIPGTGSDRAEAGKDFEPTTGVVTFPAGTADGTQKVVQFNIYDDRVLDRTDYERFQIEFFHPVNADFGYLNRYGLPPGVPGPGPGYYSILTMTYDILIEDDDAAIPRFTKYLYSTREPAAGVGHTSVATIIVELVDPAEREVSVRYDTGDPYYPYNTFSYDPATQGVDYLRAQGTLTFEPSITSRTFTVTVIGDNEREESEYLGMWLFDGTPSGKVDFGPVPDADEIQPPPYRTYANLQIIDKDNRLPGGDDESGAPGDYEGELYSWLFDDTCVSVDTINGAPSADVSLLVCNDSGDCGRLVVHDMTGVGPFFIDTGIRYDAGTLQQLPAVRANVVFPSGVPVPTSLKAMLVFDGVRQTTVTYDVSNFVANNTYQFGVQLDQMPVWSGVYDWTMEITATFGDGTVDDIAVKGKKCVVVRDAVTTGSPPPPRNPYGNGWDVSGIDRLHVRYDALLVDGTGRMCVFLADPATAGFRPQVGEFGSLVKNPDATFTYTSPEGTCKVFGPDGRILRQVDRHGLTILYTYDSQNRLSTTLDPDGRLATYAYDATTGYLDRIDHAGDRTFDVTIDSAGNLTRIVYPDGGIGTYTYDSFGRLRTDSYGPRTVTLSYDTFGLLQSVDAGGGTVTAVEPAFKKLCGTMSGRQLTLASNVRATVTDAESQTTTITQDFAGRLVRMDTPDGGTRTWEYDSEGRLQSATDPLGRVTRYEYASYAGQASADVSRVTYPDGTSEAFTYDDQKFHQLTGHTDELDRLTTIALNEFGDPLVILAADNALTTFTWGTAANGRLGLVETVARPDTDTSVAVTAYGYDDNRRLETVTDPAGGVTTYLYDSKWDLRSVTDPLGNTTTTVYDLMRRLESVTDAENRTTTYLYNAPGWRIGAIDPAGNRTSYAYDAAGRGWVTMVTDAVGTARARSTVYGYDTIGRPKTVTDPLNHTTTYAYDTPGRTVTATDPLLGLTTTAYDVAGQLAWTADPLGRRTTLAYDPRGRVRAAFDRFDGIDPAYPVDLVARLRYDAAGNVTRVRAPAELTGSDTLKVNQSGNTWQFVVAAAMDGQGRSAVFWLDTLYGTGYDVQARFLDAAGRPVANEFRASVTQTGTQYGTSAAANAAGRFMVGWADWGTGGAYARAFDATGAALTADIRLDSGGAYSGPQLAVREDGSFVAVWMEWDGYAPYSVGRVFAADGTPLCAKFTLRDASEVNKYSQGPGVAAAPGGGFVVTYGVYSTPNDPDWGFFARRFDATGAALGLSFLVNGTTAGNQGGGAPAFLPDGSMVFAYTTPGVDGSGTGVVLRRFAADGTAPGSEVLANAATTGDQSVTGLRADADGRLVVSWNTLYGSGSWDVFVRQFGPDLVARGGDVRVSPASNPTHPYATSALAGDPDGDFLVAWSRNEGSTYEWDVAARRYTEFTTTSLSYDNMNRVTAVTEAYGTPAERTTQYTYDGAGRLLSETAPAGRVTSYIYDTPGRQVRTIEAPGQGALLQRTTTVQYDAAGRVWWVMDPRQTRTSYAYDKTGRVTVVAEADNFTQLRRVWGYHYDAAGRLDQVTDPTDQAVTTTFAYDALWRLTGMTEGANLANGLRRTTTFEYDLNDNRTAVVDPLSRRSEVVYDELGRPKVSIDPLSNRTTMAYDKASQLLSTTDPRGGVTTYAYDVVGRVTRVTEAFGAGSALERTTTMVYDRAGNVLELIDPFGVKTRTAYDALGRPTAVTEAWDTPLARTNSVTWRTDDQPSATTDAAGTVTSYTYDLLGRLTSITEAVGLSLLQRTTTLAYNATDLTHRADPMNVVTTFGYDALGRTTLMTEALGEGSQLERSTTFTYDRLDRVTGTTNGRGHATAFQYDALGRLTTTTNAKSGVATTAYDLADRVVASFDELGRRTTYSYDALDRPTGVTDPLNHATTLAYQAAGAWVRVTDARGKTTTVAYDVLGRAESVTNAKLEVTSYRYDKADRLVGLTNGRNHSGTLTYDPLGRLTAQADPWGHGPQYDYDALDRLTKVTDADGRVTTLAYDELGRLLTKTDPLDHTVTMAYDKADRLTTLTNAIGAVTLYAYDKLGRRTRVQDAENGVVTMAYDKSDNLTTLIDPVGNATTFAYDELDRVTGRTDARGKRTTYAYDAASQLTEVTDRLGRRREFHYDAAGRLDRETWYAAGGAVTERVTYGYDAADNQTSAANSAGSYALTYDDLNRAEVVTNPWGKTLTFTYDAAGNRTRVQDSAGGVTTGVYDKANRLESRQFSDGTRIMRADFLYTVRDELLTVTRYSNLAGTTQVGQTTYGYDAAGRTEVVKHKDGGGSWFDVLTYTYDNADRLTAEVRNGTTVSYDYDDTDQLTQAGTLAYDYDPAGNRDSSGYTTTAGNRMTSDGVWNYGTDDEGNLTGKTRISDGYVWAYTYDNANRLVRAVGRVSAGGTITADVSYAYDAWGNLVRRTERDGSGVVTKDEKVSVDGWKVEQDFWGTVRRDVGLENFDQWLVETETPSSGGGDEGPESVPVTTEVTRRVYADGVDEPLVRFDSRGTAWYHGDVRGSVVALTNGSGVVQTRTSYDGFGNRTDLSGASFADGYGYTARMFDAVVGLDYARARWYDPATGKWHTEDPIGFAAGDYNLSRYAGNGPTNATDPSGLRQVVGTTDNPLRPGDPGVATLRTDPGPDLSGLAAELRNWDPLDEFARQSCGPTRTLRTRTEEESAEGWGRFWHRVNSAIRFGGGTFEVIAGSTILGTPGVNIIAGIGGAGLVVIGADDMNTGWRGMWSDGPVRSARAELVANLTDDPAAEFLVDVGPPILFGRLAASGRATLVDQAPTAGRSVPADIGLREPINPRSPTDISGPSRPVVRGQEVLTRRPGQGPAAMTTPARLDALARSEGPTVDVYTRLSGPPTAVREVHLSLESRALADSVPNPTATHVYHGRVPRVLIDELERAGLATRSTTQMGGVVGIELEVYTPATEWIVPFLRKVP